MLEYALINTTDNGRILDVIKESMEVCLLVADTINALIGADAVVCILIQGV